MRDLFDGGGRYYLDGALAPCRTPLATFETDPVAFAPRSAAHGYDWVELDAYSEVELELGRG